MVDAMVRKQVLQMLYLFLQVLDVSPECRTLFGNTGVHAFELCKLHLDGFDIMLFALAMSSEYW